MKAYDTWKHFEMTLGALHWVARQDTQSWSIHVTGAFGSSCLTSQGHTALHSIGRANKKEAAMLLIGCDVFRQANRGLQFISVRLWPDANEDRAGSPGSFGAIRAMQWSAPSLGSLEPCELGSEVNIFFHNSCINRWSVVAAHVAMRCISLRRYVQLIRF